MQAADSERIAQQRAGARRTALALASVALAIFLAFVLRGVIGQ